MKNVKIILGVSAGIASYKTLDLVRLLVKEGAEVRVVMSANAAQFVTPLTFEAISGFPVYCSIFDAQNSMEHIRVAENADLFVVAPATASILAKMANGLADDALSCTHLAFKGPVLVAPAMNEGMWNHTAVKQNISTLKSRGVEFIDPESGDLACGAIGQGRLADITVILDKIKNYFIQRDDLKGIRFLITAGPTHEAIDPVRYLSNPSSGKMGYALAEQVKTRGGKVTLISGPTNLKPPLGVNFKACKKAEEMNLLVQENLEQCDVLVMAAAVGDFAAENLEKEKIKKQGDKGLVLKLVATKDILLEVAKRNLGKVVVGFAAETQNLVESALDKLKKKNLDLIIANDISSPGIGFQSDSNKVTIIDREESIENLPLKSKREISDLLLDRILALVKST
ncbi:MAG: bifunctional phosphopantothenoylcysteine decarboxylase/phosphopantothenate--cysteine ligase CoaBC [Nitrospinaceae bacterium]|nr:bifunctional phosphopantothenoylcysteine decarboxylase/phosphopantothenate--cysteine ligase CoaBC [Nitrospinaceae bacterium]